MTAYSPTTWVTGDLITAVKANNWETQYACAKAEAEGGNWALDGVYSLAGPSTTPDYVIYKDGSNYKAYNPLTNAIDSSSTTFNTVVAYCYTTLAGACVTLRNGTYSAGAGLQLWGTAYIGGRLTGASKNRTIITASSAADQGTVDLRTSHFTLDNLSISGGGQATTGGLYIGNRNEGDAVHSDYASWCTTIMNVEILTCSDDAIRLRNNWYYTSLINVRAMDAITDYGLQIKGEQDTWTWSSGDNGQLTVLNCELDGGMGSVKHTPHTGESCHRINFIRCGFYGGYDGTNQVDTTGAYNIKFDNCDWEMGAAFTGKVGLQIDGGGVTLISCVFFTNANNVTFLTTSQGYTQGKVLFYNCDFCFENNTASTYAGYVTDQRGTTVVFHNCDIQANKNSSGDVSGYWCKYPLGGSVFVWDKLQTTNYDYLDQMYGSALDAKWTKAGSGTAAVVADDFAGAILLNTGAVLNQDVTISWNGNRVFDPSRHVAVIFNLKFPTAVTEIEFQGGLWKDASNYMMVTVDRPTSASNAYYYDIRSGGTSSTASFGGWAPGTTTTWKFMIEIVRGKKNGSTSTGLCAVHLDDGAGSYNRIEVTTNIPSTSKLEPYFHLKTTDASTKDAKIAYFFVEQD